MKLPLFIFLSKTLSGGRKLKAFLIPNANLNSNEFMVGCYRYPLFSNPIFEGFEQGALKSKHFLGRYHMIDILKFDLEGR